MKKLYLGTFLIALAAALFLSIPPCYATAVPPTPQPVQLSKELPSAEQPSFFQRAGASLEKTFSAGKRLVSNAVEKTSSPWIRLLFTFLLGILMSLTPCIYPMVPITVGLLQTTASSSLWRNFLLALSYTVGIATTFALLGLLAAAGSAHFGALLGNAWFVLILVTFLTYMALTMLGICELHVPRFMRGRDSGAANGSFISAFIFGVISGTVASPCLSPGLLLLISIVATIGSKLAGFFLLFTFGIGLGMPLLIIGTFSNALQLMPKAGFWMVEVKKLFGLLLLSMCFYYLSNVLPSLLVFVLAGLTLLAVGAFYMQTARSGIITRRLRFYRLIFGVLLAGSSLLPFIAAYHAYMQQSNGSPDLTHSTLSYAETRAQAVRDHHLIILDFGASWCSSCTAIKKNIIGNEAIRKALPAYTFFYVDCTDPANTESNKLRDAFHVMGYPTVLLIDPVDEKVIAHWGGEIASMSVEQFSTLVLSYA